LKNLIRKEMRLLWPLWLLLVTCIVGTAFIGALQLLPDMSTDRLAAIAAVVVIGFNLLSMILAGSLSMGEERTLGTQSWHLTLPVPAGLQWLVKLTIGLFASFAGLASSFYMAQIAFGEAFTVLLPTAFQAYGILYLLLVSSIVSFAAFWCACAVKGTVRAALCVFPALGLVLSAFSAGLSLAGWLVGSDLLESSLLKFHPFPFAGATKSFLELTIGRYAVPWVLLAPLALALVQTRRLFRQDIGDSILAALRYLLPVATVAFVCSFTLFLPYVVVLRAGDAIYRTIYETHYAAGKLQLDVAQLSPTQPQPIALEELSRVAPLSNAARTLLRDATITVRAKTADADWLEIHKRHSSEYFTAIHFRNGWDCTAYGGPYLHCRTANGESIGIKPPRD
jgi:hypothetical protein